MYEQKVQPYALKVVDFDEAKVVPFNLHIGVSNAMLKYFGHARIDELEAFIRYVVDSLNIRSLGCKDPKSALEVDITKKPNSSNRNGDIMNGTGTAFMAVFVNTALGVVQAFRHVFETISHELIHLKQYAYGELSTGKDIDGTVRWNWQGNKLDQTSVFQEYISFPFEREAFSNQCNLIDAWLRRCTLLGTPSNL